MFSTYQLIILERPNSETSDLQLQKQETGKALLKPKVFGSA